MTPTRKPKQPAATLVTPPGFNADAREIAELDEELAVLRAQMRKLEERRRSVTDRLRAAGH